MNKNLKKYESKLKKILSSRAGGHEFSLAFAEGVLWAWYNSNLITHEDYETLLNIFCMQTE